MASLYLNCAKCNRHLGSIEIGLDKRPYAIIGTATDIEVKGSSGRLKSIIVGWCEECAVSLEEFEKINSERDEFLKAADEHKKNYDILLNKHDALLEKREKEDIEFLRLKNKLEELDSLSMMALGDY